MTGYLRRRRTRAHTVSLPRIRMRLVRADEADTAEYRERIPATWGDCQQRALGTPSNPCAYLRCRYNLLVDVDPSTGSYKITWPDLAGGHYRDEYEQLPAHTCALRVAEIGGMTLDEVGRVINVTRERVRQIETRALRALADFAALVKFVDDEIDAGYVPWATGATRDL